MLDLKWDLQPGGEAFWCKRVTVKDDFWIRGFRPLAPKGTHHVTVSKLAGPDGVWRCTGTMVETDLIFGVGVGSGDQVLPGNAAVKINAGDQLDLNVHVLNTSNDPIEATSGVGVLTARAEESFDEAGFVLAGATAALVVPPGRSTQHGTCIIPTNASLLGVMPHMHLLGVHQDATLDHGTDSTTLFDADYDFNEQLLYWQPSPLPLEAGDVVRVACTYENPTPDSVYFGESTHNEMCFLGLYTTPPISRMNGCVN